jgi:hypothetical protein
LFASAAIAALAATSVAPCQPSVERPASTSRTLVYDAAFFSQFAPRTAYDIVQRVPGFALDLGATQTTQGSVDVRGFAGTAGNVVINGSRPSTKAETLDVTLARIPAQRVVRVELGPGDLYGSDYAGKNQVLNVVLSEQSGIDANIQLAARRWSTGYINSDAQGSILIRRGASTINLSAGTGRNRQLQDGPDTVTDLSTGAVTERRFKRNSYFNRNPFLSAAWSLERGSDRAIHLNARWQPSRFDLTQDNRVTPAAGLPHDDNLFQHYRDPVLELGGDVTEPLGGGAIKLLGLVTRRKRNDTDIYVQRDGLLSDNPSIDGGFDQTVKARRNETIGRLSWTRSNLAGFSFEAGSEGAVNTLVDDVNFAETEADGTRIPIDLPISHATVKETRGEVYVNVGRTLSPALRIDGGVNYEFSKLTVRGDATADRSLKFLKPNLTLDSKLGGGWHGQLSIRRTVAQLDFYDFISVADLSVSHVNGGNADLQPQRTWEFRATADHPLLGDGLVKLELGHDLISKLQDRILIVDAQGVGFDSPGNLGTGRRYYATLTVDAPLTRLWNGLRAKFTGTAQRTRVADPISGKLRQFSGYYPNWQWNVDVRRDHGRFSYGFVVSDNQRWTNYRTDEFDANFQGGPYGTAFVEYRPAPKTAITFDVDNAFNTTANLDRLIFTPNRAFPTKIVDELRNRNNHLDIGLTLKQSFGGGSSGTKVASKAS